MIEVKAPAVVKLFGEHATVYGKLSLAAAVSLYATAAAQEYVSKELFRLDLPDLKLSCNVPMWMLEKVASVWKSRDSKTPGKINETIEKLLEEMHIDSGLLPYVVIAARLHSDHKAALAGLRIAVNSEIPVSSGYASSAACVTAFTAALAKACKLGLGDEEFIDIARDGDRIIHKNEGAGRIDVSTCYYGGYVSYSAGTGPVKLDIDTQLNLLLVNTGPKKPTSETVGHIADLYKADRANTEQALDNIGRYAKDGIAALKNNDLLALGGLMNLNQQILKGLGVSSEGLDTMSEISSRNFGLGAKLSGGGGGGLGIVLVSDEKRAEKITDAMREAGFDVKKVPVEFKGVKSAMKQKATVKR